MDGQFLFVYPVPRINDCSLFRAVASSSHVLPCSSGTRESQGYQSSRRWRERERYSASGKQRKGERERERAYVKRERERKKRTILKLFVWREVDERGLISFGTTDESSARFKILKFMKLISRHLRSGDPAPPRRENSARYRHANPSKSKGWVSMTSDNCSRFPQPSSPSM